MAGVPVVHFVRQFVSGQFDLGSIHHDDKIAGVNTGGENGLVLAPKNPGDLCGDPAENLVFHINHEPVPLDIRLFGYLRAHVIPLYLYL